MIVHDTYVTVEVGEKGLEELLTLVKEGRTVRIVSAGQPVADLSQPRPRRELVPIDPRLKVTFNVAPEALTSPEDWPEHVRIDVPPQP